MQFDVPNTHISNSQSRPRCRSRSRPSPRDAGTSVGMCAACVCYGLRDEAREQGMRAETRERHDRGTHDYLCRARKLMCVGCSRGGLGLLTSPVGVESQRPETTKALHNNRFLARDPIGVISHVITSSSLPSLSSSAQVGHPSAALRWLAFCVQRCRCARR
jgi:hypothetical protein